MKKIYKMQAVLLAACVFTGLADVAVKNRI